MKIKSFLSGLLFILFLFPVPAFSRQTSGNAKIHDLMALLSGTVKHFKQATASGAKDAAAFKRDPMTPLLDATGNVIQTKGLSSDMAIQGIIWADGFKRVLVDDEFYAEGSTVGPYRILEIQKEGFWAGTAEGRKFIPLYSEGSDPNQNPA